MHDRLKSAFDAVHTEDALKGSTLAYISAQAEKQQRNFRPMVRLVPALACLLLLVMSFAGYRLYFTPTSVISIDINPSLELGVNRFDRIVSVTSYNADGEELASQLQIRFMDYSEALEQILSNDTVEACLSEDNTLSIAVVGDDTTQCSRLLSGVEYCTTGHENAHCYSTSTEEVAAAHDCGLSYGKYKALLELQALDPSITAEDIQDMTMRQIQDLIDALSETDTDSASIEEETSGHHGQGYPGKGQDHQDQSDLDSCTETTGQGSGQGAGNGDGQGSGQGPGYGDGQGNGQGSGQGPGNGDGQGNGQGPGTGDGQGNGQGSGNGDGQGNHRGSQHRN